MKRGKLHPEKSFEYPLEKARVILEEDGTFLNDDELKQLVNVLTLLAKQEAELINSGKAKKV